MARLLVVHHSPAPMMDALTEAVIAGAHDDEVVGVEVVVREALEASTSANFGYMSGALKHFFDTIFLEAGGALSDDGSASAGARQGKKPYGLWVHGRYDTTGAVRSVQSIVGALPWVPAAAVLEVLGDVTEEHRAAAYELGGTLAALLTS